jgi:hypothetical protein
MVRKEISDKSGEARLGSIHLAQPSPATNYPYPAFCPAHPDASHLPLARHRCRKQHTVPARHAAARENRRASATVHLLSRPSFASASR